LEKEEKAKSEALIKDILSASDLKASKCLREAARNIEGNPTALQLRYLQTLSDSSGDGAKTILFPLNSYLMKNFCTQMPPSRS